MTSSHRSCPALPELRKKFAIQVAAPSPSPSGFRKLSDDHYTQIPNVLFNLVLSEKLLPRDLMTYAALLARSGIAAHVKGQDYIFPSEEDLAADLQCCVRTIRASIARLLKEDILERLDTPGNTRTRILLYVDYGSKIVRRPPGFVYQGVKAIKAAGLQASVAINESDFDDPFPEASYRVETGSELPLGEEEVCPSITLDS